MSYDGKVLYVGTTSHLEEMDRGYSVATDVSVTAIATGASQSSYVLLDGDRVDELGELELRPVALLGGQKGQSIGLGVDGQLVVGLEGARLAVLSPAGNLQLLEAFDSVSGREDWENPAGPVPDLRTVSVDDDNTWFIGVHVGGLWRTRDQGRSFEQVIEPEADVHEVRAGSKGRVCVAAARGFGWSTDGGTSWQWTDAGLHASYCRAVALSDTTVLLSASTGPRTTDGRLYRASLGSDFEPVGRGMPASFPDNLETGTVDLSGNEAAVGTRSGELYRSFDGAQSWQKTAEEMRPVTFVRFAR
jgi:hypothetical protein